MGDVRFARTLESVKSATDPTQAIRELPDEDLLGALASASPEDDALLLNVLATEAQNRSRRSRTIRENIGDGVYVVDTGGRIVFVNPAGARMLGCGPDRLLGRTEHEAIHFLDASERPVPQDGLPHVEVLRSGEPMGREDWSIMLANGRRLPVTFTAAPVRHENDIEGVVLVFRDDTHRRRAEAHLRASEERYRLLAENATDIVCRMTPTGEFTYVSPAARTILGYAPEDLLGAQATPLLHPVDAERVQREYPVPPLEPWTTTYRARRADGEWVWLESHARAIRDSRGEVKEIVAVTRDITDRMLAQEALTRSERHLEEAQHLARLGSWEIDLAGNEFACSDELLRIMGLTARERPLTVEKVLNAIPRADRLLVLQLFEGALRMPAPFAYEHAVVRPDGTMRQLQCRADVVVDEEGRPTKILGTSLDVTEQKAMLTRLRETEERHHLIVDHMRDVILCARPEGRVTYASTSARRVLGYEPTDLVGTDGFALLHPDDREAYRRDLPALLQRPDGWTRAVRILRRDGAWIWAETAVRAVRDPKTGEPQELVGVVRDITERREIESELRSLAHIFEGAGDPIIELDLEGRVVRWNRAAASAYGIASSAASGRRFTDIVPAPAVEQMRAILERAAKGESTSDLVSIRVAGSGRTRDVAVRSMPLHDADGRVRGCLLFERDITRERDEAYLYEDRFRRILTEAPIAFWSVDPRGTVTLVQGRGLAALGFDAGKLIGTSVYAKTGNGPEARLREAIRQALGGESVVDELERDGHRYEVHYSAARDRHGIILGVVAVAWDVTEQRRAEAEFARVRKIMEGH